MLELGPRAVIIKKGEHGALMFSEEGIFSVPSYPLEDVIDPTGAGDSFAGALMGYLASTDDTSIENLRRAVVRGSVVASTTVQDFSLRALAALTTEEAKRRYETVHGTPDPFVNEENRDGPGTAVVPRRACRHGRLLVLAGPARSAEGTAEPSLDLTRDVRQILSEKCFTCHGPDPKERKGGLRLDMPEGVFKPAASGSRRRARQARRERLYRGSSDDPGEHMPPAKSGKTPQRRPKSRGSRPGSSRGPRISDTGHSFRRSGPRFRRSRSRPGAQPDRCVHPGQAREGGAVARRPRPTGSP